MDPHQRFTATQGPRIIHPRDGKMIDLGSVGVRFMIWGEESGGGFSLVEHPIPPGHLAAPMHRHSKEDEYSFILEGRLGASFGGQVVYADRGDLVFKPRDQWHTFWNAGDSVCRILEIISPGGFEHYFEDVVADRTAGARYGVETDPAATARIREQYKLK
jgi:mannose-6-phosphate isomerase-like protein (cupin superfamily)